MPTAEHERLLAEAAEIQAGGHHPSLRRLRAACGWTQHRVVTLRADLMAAGRWAHGNPRGRVPTIIPGRIPGEDGRGPSAPVKVRRKFDEAAFDASMAEWRAKARWYVHGE